MFFGFFALLSVVAGLLDCESKVVYVCAVVCELGVVCDLVVVGLVDDCILRACLIVVVDALVGLILPLHLISSSISLLYSLSQMVQ